MCMHLVSMQHREQRAQQEKQQLQQKNDWLEGELKDRVNELLALKRNQVSHPGNYLKLNRIFPSFSYHVL